MKELIKDGIIYSIIILLTFFIGDLLTPFYGFPITLSTSDGHVPQGLINENHLINSVIAIVIGFGISYLKNQVVKK